MSVRSPQIGDTVISSGGGGGSQGVSTRQAPTPSASELFGTSAQRESQIRAFRSGGQQAFERIKQQQRQLQQQKQREENQRKQQESIRIQIETQKKIALIQREIRKKQIGKTTKQKIQLQQQQRRLIENILINQTKKKVNMGLIKKGFVKVKGGTIEVSKSPQRKIITKQIPQTKKLLQPSKAKKIKKPTRKEKRKRIKEITRKLVPTKSQLRKLKNISIKAFDSISAGSITEFRLNKRENKLNQEIDKYNKEFGNKTLTEKEFNKAVSQGKNLDKIKKQIDKEKDNLAQTIKSKLGRIIGTLDPFERLTPKEKKKQMKQLPKIKKQLKELDSKIKQLEKKQQKNISDKIKLRSLKSKKFGLNREVIRIESGKGIRVLMGDLPIIPASSIPRGITSIKFIGKQKRLKSGRVITDIVFKTSKGNVGVAKGVSVQKGAKGQSVVLGRFAKTGVKFPSTKIKIGKLRSFISVEKTISKQKVFKIKKTFRLGKKGRKISIIKGNLQGLQQAGIGKTAVVKGKKFFRTSIRFPSGKIAIKRAKGISVDDFASLSSVFTKKELSLIIGKSITEKGAKAKFIGIIKGTSKVGKGSTFSIGQKQQFTKATQKLVSATSSAIAKAEQTTRGASKLVILSKASDILSKSLKIGKPIVTTRTIKQKTITSTKRITPTKQIQQTKKMVSKIRSVKAKQINRQLTKLRTLQIQQTKQKQKTKQLQKQLSKTTSKQKVRQIQRQLQIQKQRITQIQKQLQKQISRINPKLTSLGIPRLPIIPIIIITKRKRLKTIKTKKKTKKLYKVFIKIRGKFIRLRIKPLKQSDALSKGAYEADNNLLRTFKIVPVSFTNNQGKLLKKERNYFNKNKFKFRKQKIRKGVKFELKRTYIEKKKYVKDTIREKRQLQILRNKRRSIKKRRPIKKRKQRRPIKKRKQRRPIKKRRTIKKKRKNIKRKKRK